MPIRSKAKDVRIDIRTSNEVKRMLQNAADLLGTTISAFVVAHAYESAQKVLAEHNALVLSQKDADIFLARLENPLLANDALQKLLTDN